MAEKKTKPSKYANNRPKYTPELAEEICDRIAGGESLRSICDEKRMPAVSCVLQWVVKDTGGFALAYARAREAQGHVHAMEIEEINDKIERGDLDPQQGRVIAENKKWLAERTAPKSFSPTQIIKHGKADDEKDDDEIMSEFTALAEKLNIPADTLALRGKNKLQ